MIAVRDRPRAKWHAITGMLMYPWTALCRKVQVNSIKRSMPDFQQPNSRRIGSGIEAQAQPYFSLSETEVGRRWRTRPRRQEVVYRIEFQHLFER